MNVPLWINNRRRGAPLHRSASFSTPAATGLAWTYMLDVGKVTCRFLRRVGLPANCQRNSRVIQYNIRYTLVDQVGLSCRRSILLRRVLEGASNGVNIEYQINLMLCLRMHFMHSSHGPINADASINAGSDANAGPAGTTDPRRRCRRHMLGYGMATTCTEAQYRCGALR